MSDSHSIVERGLDELSEFTNNPKAHDVDDLSDSIETFGYVAPIIVNTENNTILAGHGRLKALRKMHEAGEQRPKGVGDDGNGGWAVAVLDVSVDPELHEAFIVRDNKSTERGGWDASLLKVVLERQKELGLFEKTGFREQEYSRLMRDTRDLWPKEREWTDGGLLDSAASEFGIEAGTLLQIGRHRVLCGDSTDPASWRRVRGDVGEGLVLTDPPYCMAAEQIAVHAPEGEPRSVITNDDARVTDYKKLITPIFELTPAKVVYAFCSWERWCDIRRAAEEHGFRIKTMAVWDKGRQALWNDWGNQHELILVAHDVDYKERSKMVHTNVFSMSSQPNKLHPTAKPIELITELLPIDVVESPVMDPFLGSGSTLLACERLNRPCYGIELEPKFVAATVARARDAGLEVEKIDA